MTCFLGVTNFDKPTSQGATSTDPSGDPHDHLAVHCDTAERSISPSRSPGTIEDVNCDPPEMCIDSTRFSASDVLDLKKTEDKRLGISEHGSGPPFSQGTNSPTSTTWNAILPVCAFIHLTVRRPSAARRGFLAKLKFSTG